MSDATILLIAAVILEAADWLIWRLQPRGTA